MWKAIERACVILGALFTAVSAYYGAATYYGWNVAPAVSEAQRANAMSAPVWFYVGAAVGLGLLLTGWAMMAVRFRERRAAPIASLSISQAEMQYRVQQRKFVSSNLNQGLEAYLAVMSEISVKCSRVAGTGIESDVSFFADYGVDRALRRRFALLRDAATNNFSGQTTEKTNDAIMDFLAEYENASTFPRKIEEIAKLERTPRDNWLAAHNRCDDAIRDLRASEYAGSLLNTTRSVELTNAIRQRINA